MADSSNRKIAGGAGVAVGLGLLVSILWGFEGNEPIAYLDPVGIPTVCVGHTGPEVSVGQRKTDAECRALLTGDALIAWDAVARDVSVDLQPYEHAAFASFTFNVGERTFQGSTMLKLINQNRVAEACGQLPLWVYAGRPPRKLPGLVKRRDAEMKLCLGGGT